MKIICVPKDLVAKNHLNLNKSQPNELIELNIDDESISKLWDLDFFNSINKLAHSNIDIFEDENIVEKDRLLTVLNSNIFDARINNGELQQIIDRIKDLLELQ